MVDSPCFWPWNERASQYLQEIPEHPVRDQMLRAIKEILRHSSDTPNQWISHAELWTSLRLRQRYPMMGPQHVHAIICASNAVAATFDVYQEWSTQEPWRLVMYWYRPTPGSFIARWHSDNRHANKEVSKCLAYFLRKICRRQPTKMTDALQYLSNQVVTVSMQQLELIVAYDSGRFARHIRNGEAYVVANARFDGIYRTTSSNLDADMEGIHGAANQQHHIQWNQSRAH